MPKIPGPDHAITVEPTSARVVARVGGRIPADTDKALTLREASYPAVQYAPLAEVDQDVIRYTETHTRELGVHRRKVKRIIDQAAQDAGRLVA